MKFAVTFGRLNPAVWVDVALAADRLGFDSVWLPEHLVIPMAMEGSPFAGADHPPVPPTTPVFDPVAYFSFLAAQTQRLRFGTYVYLLGLRHPFVPARGFATLDIVSGGRAILGAGAGWLAAEWQAVGVDPSTRGARLDESIGVCRRLWTEESVEHHGEHFDFPPVAFEPKPVQRPIPIHVGGESRRALQRAAALGDGWLGMSHTPPSAAAQVAELRRLAAAAGRPHDEIEVTVMGECQGPDDVAAWTAAGVDRLIVSPWARSSGVLEGMADFARRLMGPVAP